VSHIKEVEVHLDDGLADPRVLATELVGCAEADHRFDRRVATHFVRDPCNRALEAARNVKVIERQNPALDRVNPVHVAIVTVVRHREQTDGVGLDRQFRVDDWCPEDVFRQLICS